MTFRLKTYPILLQNFMLAQLQDLKKVDTIFISVDMSMDWPMGTLLLRTSQFSFVLVLEKPRTLLHLDLLPPGASGIVGLAHREFFLKKNII